MYIDIEFLHEVFYTYYTHCIIRDSKITTTTIYPI